jgi:hypothetical protein
MSLSRERGEPSVSDDLKRVELVIRGDLWSVAELDMSRYRVLVKSIDDVAFDVLGPEIISVKLVDE